MLLQFIKTVSRTGSEGREELVERKMEEFIAIDILEELSKIIGPKPAKGVLFEILKERARQLLANVGNGRDIAEVISEIVTKGVSVQSSGDRITLTANECPLSHIRDIEPEKCVAPLAVLAGLIEGITGARTRVETPSGKYGSSRAEYLVRVESCGKTDGKCVLTITRLA